MSSTEEQKEQETKKTIAKLMAMAEEANGGPLKQEPGLLVPIRKRKKKAE